MESSDVEDSGEYPQIFVIDDCPAYFALHNSIQSKKAHQALADKITAHGGDLVDNDIQANIVLFNPARFGWNQQAFQRAYDAHEDARMREIWVRDMSFVDDCIEEGRLILEYPPTKPMSGFPSGKKRTPFTPEDEKHLCGYIARLLPDASSGGRLGRGFYKDMVALATCLPDVYKWTRRHSYQSWHQHYKKNQDRLNQQIERLTQEEPNPKGHHSKDRRLNANGDEARKSDDEERNKQGDEEEMVLVQASQRKRRRVSRKGKEKETNDDDENDDKEDQEGEGQEEDEGIQEAHQVASSSRVVAPRLRTRMIPAEIPGPSQTLVNTDPPLQGADEGEGEGPDEVEVQGHRSSSPNIPAYSPERDIFQQIPITLEEMMEETLPSPVRQQKGPVAPTDKPSQEVTAPYRNTRSRSRSATVEPPPIVPSSSHRKKKGPASRKPPPLHALSPLPEAPSEAENQAIQSDNDRDPLFSYQDSSDPQDQEADVKTETEDVEIPRKRLRSHVQEESEDDRQAREILRNAQLQNARAGATPIRGRARARGRGGSRKQAAPASVVSETSSAEVPLPSTRASEMKKQLIRKGARTPFKPLPGTQAFRQAGRVKG